MRKIYSTALLSAFLLAASLFDTYAQVDAADDFGVWSTVTVKKKIVGGFSASISGELRTRDASKEVYQWFVNPELQYKFNEYFDVNAGYRFVRTAKALGSFEPVHRWYAGVSAAVGFGPVRLQLREIFEQFNYTERDISADNRVLNYLRSRLRLEVAVKEIYVRPYADVEHFWYVAGYRAGDTGMIRYTAGVKIPVAKMHTFDIYYRYVQQFSSSRNTNVLGLAYSLSF